MNVVGEEAWVSYYGDFPICRVDLAFAIRARAGGAAGGSALAVSGDTIALIGGYRPHRFRLVLGRLGREALEDATTWKLALPGDRDLPEEAIVMARNQYVHAIAEGVWYRLDITELEP